MRIESSLIAGLTNNIISKQIPKIDNSKIVHLRLEMEQSETLEYW